MNRPVQILAGLLGGVAVGALAGIVHSGPVDRPIIGLVLAFCIVASTAWFVLESGWKITWLVGLIAVAATTVWMLMFPTAGDIFISVDQWPSQAWLLLAPTSALLPALWAGKAPKTEGQR